MASSVKGSIEYALVESVPGDVEGSGAGVVLGFVDGPGVGEGVGVGVETGSGVGVGVGVGVGEGVGVGVVDGGVLEPTVAGPEVPGPQFSVLLELLELDELVTVPWPSSVVTGFDGVPPAETSTQFDEAGDVAVVMCVGAGVNFVLTATEMARVIASCTAGGTVRPTAAADCPLRAPAGTKGPTTDDGVAAGPEIPVLPGNWALPGNSAAVAEITAGIEANAIAAAVMTAVTHMPGVDFIGGPCLQHSGRGRSEGLRYGSRPVG